MFISKTKSLITGIDVRQVAKWIIFIFIYSVFMPDIIWNSETLWMGLLFGSHRLHVTVDGRYFTTCCFLLAHFYSLFLYGYIEPQKPLKSTCLSRE